jgi:hypothetical protein
MIYDNGWKFRGVWYGKRAYGQIQLARTGLAISLFGYYILIDPRWWFRLTDYEKKSRAMLSESLR